MYFYFRHLLMIIRFQQGECILWFGFSVNSNRLLLSSSQRTFSHYSVIRSLGAVSSSLHNLGEMGKRGDYPLHLNPTDGFPCLKEADICVYYPKETHSHQMVGLLQQLHNVKFLTLNLEFIELLSSSVELISQQPSLFVNLKRLTIYPHKVFEYDMRGLPKGKVNLSTELKQYLLDSSPGATITMISPEEIIASKDAASAKKLMTELRVLLEQEKANTKTKGKAPMVSNNGERKMQLQIGGNRALIKNYWKDLNVQFEQRKAKAYIIISKLESIEEVLKKLPAANRALIQPCFSRICAQADNLMNQILKMQCDEIQSRTSVFS
uniref:uncharacterized protein LOC122593900 isoform X2 n=1 Tax=Erigeron canadensis TaxID=72917 RepID=UPI001CB910F3|nr:uncharacterized protein LOC122593900 isoform X2 [Erigeron canadensis]